uniref:Protein-tyrosine sulfotransferase n=1 Tax=Corethron hystrix TaxID=216773 RepID=A0A7S1BCT9_9STRA|mmetsp:Transcript_21903/g.49837  ORF Transcript_21903/g.49837 Transcript_21903/m.49837 type:complete len:660 (+) Transcript_21903:251-2230(+)
MAQRRNRRGPADDNSSTEAHTSHQSSMGYPEGGGVRKKGKKNRHQKADKKRIDGNEHFINLCWSVLRHVLAVVFASFVLYSCTKSISSPVRQNNNGKHNSPKKRNHRKSGVGGDNTSRTNKNHNPEYEHEHFGPKVYPNILKDLKKNIMNGAKSGQKFLKDHQQFQQKKVTADLEMIAALRSQFKSHPDDPIISFKLANLLRMQNEAFRDEGKYFQESIALFERTLSLFNGRRRQFIATGQKTDVPSVEYDESLKRIGFFDERYIKLESRSVDALISSTHSHLAKTYFNANMYERAIAEFTKALQVYPGDLDALFHRAKTNVIIGNYAIAATDLLKVLENDKLHDFTDAFSSLADILIEDSSAVPGGWDMINSQISQLLHVFHESLKDSSGRQSFESRSNIKSHLFRLHHATHQYFDYINNTKSGWWHLEMSNQFKLDDLPPFNKEAEGKMVSDYVEMFKPTFWDLKVGSTSKTPIFVVGFVCTGVSLLGHILDSHPSISEVGRNSIFSGSLPQIRGSVIKAHYNGYEELKGTVEALANDVVGSMREKWALKVGSETAILFDSPDKFVDAISSNFMNVGFIHYIFPEALILHIYRDPMDTLFHASTGRCGDPVPDYASSFEGLSSLYKGYRYVFTFYSMLSAFRISFPNETIVMLLSLI